MSDSEDSESCGSAGSDIGTMFRKSQKAMSKRRRSDKNKENNHNSDNSEEDDDEISSDDDSSRSSSSSSVEGSPVGSKRTRKGGLRRNNSNNNNRRSNNSSSSIKPPTRRNTGRRRQQQQPASNDRAHTINLDESDGDDEEDVLESSKRGMLSSTKKAPAKQPSAEYLSSSEEEDSEAYLQSANKNDLEALRSLRTSRARLEKAQHYKADGLAKRLQMQQPPTRRNAPDVVDLEDNVYEYGETLSDHRFLSVLINVTKKAVCGRELETKRVRLSTRGGETFEALQEKLLKELGIENGSASVTLIYDKNRVLRKQTPNYYEIRESTFSLNATITISSVKAASNNATVSAEPAIDYGKRIALVLRISEDQKYKVHHGERQFFSDLVATAQQAIPNCPPRIRLIFDGEQLSPSGKPQDKDMEEDEIIDVKFN